MHKYESDSSQIFKVLSDCHVGKRISDLRRDAAFGQLSPVQPIQHRRPEAGRSLAGYAATPNRADIAEPAVRACSLGSCWSEGRQCQRSSGGPARRGGSGARPAARSSLAPDQAGFAGGSRNRGRCSCRFVGGKFSTAARGFIVIIIVSSSSMNMEPSKQ